MYRPVPGPGSQNLWQRSPRGQQSHPTSARGSLHHLGRAKDARTCPAPSPGCKPTVTQGSSHPHTTWWPCSLAAQRKAPQEKGKEMTSFFQGQLSVQITLRLSTSCLRCSAAPRSSSRCRVLPCSWAGPRASLTVPGPLQASGLPGSGQRHISTHRNKLREPGSIWPQ